MYIKPKHPFRKEVFGGITYDFNTEDFYYLNHVAFSLLDFLDKFNTQVEEIPFDLQKKVLALQDQGIVTQEGDNYEKKERGQLAHNDPSLLSGPVILELYPSFLCNERCTFCYVGYQVERNGHLCMQKERISTLVGKLKDAGIFNVTLLGGEPFLYPHLDDLVVALSDAKFDISLSTNGTIENPDYLALFKEKAVKLNVAFHSHIESIHNSLTRNKMGYKKTLKTIEQTIQIGYIPHVTVVLHPSNLATIDGTINFLVALGIKSLTLSYPQPTDYCKDNHSTISFADYEYTFRKGYRLGKQQNISVQGSNHYNFLLNEYNNGFNIENPLAKYLYGDKAGRSRLEMTPTGDLYPTSSLFGNPDWLVGNIFENDLLDMWAHSPVLKKIRDRSLPLFCSTCEHQEICGGGIIGEIITNKCWDKPPLDCPLVQKAL